ncbi:transposase [Azospirillum sp. B506]|uniref:transposase n=1 Tax=Azospirillum sp. B506 TaxID=137721 RepID=UPI001B3B6F02
MARIIDRIDDRSCGPGRPPMPTAEIIEALRFVPIIPSRADQPVNPDFDHMAYRRPNLVERLVGKLKQFRRVATRYDMLDAYYRAFVEIASVMVWLRSFGDRIWHVPGDSLGRRCHFWLFQRSEPAVRARRIAFKKCFATPQETR